MFGSGPWGWEARGLRAGSETSFARRASLSEPRGAPSGCPSRLGCLLPACLGFLTSEMGVMLIPLVAKIR